MCSLVCTCPLPPSTGNLLLRKTCKVFMTLGSYSAFLILKERTIKFAYGAQHWILTSETYIRSSKILVIQLFDSLSSPKMATSFPPSPAFTNPSLKLPPPLLREEEVSLGYTSALGAET